jgi:SHS2 domain-containing protein
LSEAGYTYLDDIAIADVAFRARAPNLAELCRQAGLATVHIMVDDLDSVYRRRTRTVCLDSDNAELLLFDFLQELIYFKDAEYLLLLPANVTVAETGGRYRLNGTLAGESIDPGRHPLNADVKAVTLHRFRVEHTAAGWEAEVVLDI